MRIRSFILPLVGLLAAPVLAQDLASQVNSQLPGLIDTYKDLHAHPELSHREERTSSSLAAELRKAGYTVSDGNHDRALPGLAYGINASGDITGEIKSTSGGYQGFLLRDGQVTIFNYPGGVFMTHPRDINARGDLVGSSMLSGSSRERRNV